MHSVIAARNFAATFRLTYFDNSTRLTYCCETFMHLAKSIWDTLARMRSFLRSLPFVIEIRFTVSKVELSGPQDSHHNHDNDRAVPLLIVLVFIPIEEVKIDAAAYDKSSEVDPQQGPKN